MWAHMIVALLGVWLMAAPAVFGYTDAPLESSDRVAGPLIASFATVAIWQCTRALRWLNVPLGLWVAAAAWFLDPSRTTVAVHATALGLAVIGLSLVRGKLTIPYGGGWRSLWRTERLAGLHASNSNSPTP